ncbi:putative RNA polymerase II subunit B1 CTD phosphatase Rpap2 isoform X2 [Halichondria panicea]
MGITESRLLQAADLLTVSQYSDVVDERNIDHLCGYPLCDQQLVNVPKQKYHISTATNQVLDLTQRKKFCSSQCFKASNFYRSQLSTFPPMARTTKRSMQLLPLLDSPLCKPVTEATSSQPVSVDTKQQPTTDDGSSQLVSVDTKQQPTTDDGPSQPVSVDTKQQPTTDDGSSQPVSVDTKQQPTTDDSSSQPITTDDAPLHAINLSSFESLCLSDKNTSVSNHPFNCGGGDEQFANKYIQQISDSLDIWLNTVGTKQHDHSEGVFHPPLHDMCVSQVQRSLFMSQLRSTLQSLGEGSGVMEMASSFRLTNKCVAFRPPQWKLIALLLIALFHGQEAVNKKALDISLTELKASKDHFDILFIKAKELINPVIDSI